MLIKLSTGILLLVFLVSNVSAGTAFPGASQEWLDELSKRNTAIQLVSEICGGEDKYNYSDNVDFISRVKNVLDQYTYDQVISIKSKLFTLDDDVEEKLTSMDFNGNITKYNKKFIPKDLYDKGYEFLSLNYQYDINEMNYILGSGCYPFALLSFRGPLDNNFFTQEKDYKRYKLISGLQSIIGSYLEENFYPSRKYVSHFSLYTSDGTFLGEIEKGKFDMKIELSSNNKTVRYYDITNSFPGFELNNDKIRDISSQLKGKRISELVNKTFTYEISGFKNVKNKNYDESCGIFNAIFLLEGGKTDDCEPQYHKEDMNFTIETKILPKD